MCVMWACDLPALPLNPALFGTLQTRTINVGADEDGDGADSDEWELVEATAATPCRKSVPVCADLPDYVDGGPLTKGSDLSSLSVAQLRDEITLRGAAGDVGAVAFTNAAGKGAGTAAVQKDHAYLSALLFPLLPPAPSLGPTSEAPQGARLPQRARSQGDGDPPAMLVCPITQELFEDPAFTADGQTYERAAVAQWLEGNDTSPLTNAKLPHKNLVTNFVMQRAVQGWCQKHPLYCA